MVKQDFFSNFHRLIGMFFLVLKRDGISTALKRAGQAVIARRTAIAPGAANSVTETCEFFIPDRNMTLDDYLQKEDLQGIHHLGRYNWALEAIDKLPHDRILDVACGSGFGSHMMAEKFKDSVVTGVDYDQRAIDLAKKEYRLPNLHYSAGNIISWKFEDNEGNGKPIGKFDVIISFDTIEHLLHREIAMKNIVNNLNDGGYLIFSTPCGQPVSLLNPGWEHHKVEYSNSDLYDFMKRYFKNVFRADDNSLPALDFWKEKINKDKMRYDNRMNPLVCSGPIRINDVD